MDAKRVLSLFLGQGNEKTKVQALQRLARHVPKLHANNVALLFRGRARTPFVLSVGLDNVLMLDLYAQGVEINVHTHDGVPCVKAFFDPPLALKVHDTLDLSHMFELWFSGFKTSRGFMSALAHERGSKLIATASRTIAVPDDAETTRVFGVKMDVGKDAFIVTVDVELPELLAHMVTELGKRIGHVKQVGADRFEISMQIPLEEHGAACAEKLHKGIHDKSCQAALLHLFMFLARPALDPVIVQALAEAGVNEGSDTGVFFQARSDYGEPLAEESIVVGEEDDEGTNILSFISHIAKTWKM